MTDIYDEVLAERKRLLEVAESNAKSKIIDAITPRIKEMVENALLGELDEFGDDPIDPIAGDTDMTAGLDASPDGIMPSETSIDGAVDVAGGEDAGLTLPDADGKITLDVDSFMGNGAQPVADQAAMSFELTPDSIVALESLMVGDMDLAEVQRRAISLDGKSRLLASVVAPSSADLEIARQVRVECETLYADIGMSAKIGSRDATRLSEQLERTYERIMRHYSAAGHISAIMAEAKKINEKAGAMKHALKESRRQSASERKSIITMLREVADLHDVTGKIFRSPTTDDSVSRAAIKQVGDNLAALYTEMRKMVTRNKQINEADELDVGAGAAPDAAGADMEADEFGDMESMPKTLITFEVEGDLASLAAGTPATVKDVQSGGDEIEGDDALAGLDDMGDDMDMPMDEELGDDIGMEDEEEGMAESRLRDDDIIEIDEAALVAEMRRMKKLREKKSNVNTGGHGPDHFDNFGGGKSEREMFVDSNDGDDDMHGGGDLNVLGENDDCDVSEGEDLDEAELHEDEKLSGTKKERARQKKEMGESRLRANNSKRLAETNDKLRAELTGQKLFNTKLVALNRVLQIPGLKKAQKEKVVDLLDRGRTVAEVKQMYSRIVEALKKGGENSRAIHESAQGVQGGSASRASTSAAPSNDGDAHPVLERWNKIAFGSSGLLKG